VAAFSRCLRHLRTKQSVCSISRSIDAGRNRGRRLAIPAAIAKNVRADLNITGLPWALGDPAHSALVGCAEKHRPIQKAEAGIEPEFSALPRQYSAKARPSRAGLVRACGGSHPHPPVFPGGVRHPCDKPAHTPGPYPRLMRRRRGLRHLRAPAFMFVGPPQSREGPSPRQNAQS